MPLRNAYDPDNIFAKILSGEMPCVKVYEDDETLAFMDIFPQSKGHVLVLPKAPSHNLLDAQPETLAKLMPTVQRLAQAVETALKPDGIQISQFNGSVAGQTVFHLHVHIIPRYEGEDLDRHAAMPADIETLRPLAERIAKAIC